MISKTKRHFVGIIAGILLVSSLVLRSPMLRAQTAPPNVQHDLMPVPASIEFQLGKLRIDESFSVATSGYSDQRLASAIDRMVWRLSTRTGLELRRGISSDANSANLLVSCDSAGSPVPSLDDDESYEISIAAERASLKAHTVVGVLRGLETFLQLLTADRDGYYVPAGRINDRPRFKWRGLLVDVSRHFQPVEVIKRTLDGMAAVKMNVLHWHLTDDPGFRIESKKYPKLQQMGSDGSYYTREQIRDVIAYARDRGIRVVPEFDIPGHATSWVVGYPELGSSPGPYVLIDATNQKYGILDPTNEKAYKFIDKFVGEMARLFPDEYLHIGGDEVDGKQWRDNPKIQAFMKAKGIQSAEALQTYFNQRLLKILQKHNQKMIGWDEILQPDLPKDIVVQSWRGQESLVSAAKQGYRIVLSAPYYLDHLHQLQNITWLIPSRLPLD